MTASQMPSSGRGNDLPILITMGEPSGIGPEVGMAAFDHFGGKAGNHPLKLVGDASVFASRQDALIPTQSPVTAVPGKPDVRNAAAVTEAIEIAVSLCLNGEAAALVTAPIHKAVLNAAGFAFPGHTEYLAHLTGAPRAVMMLASEKLRVVPLTIHMPIAQVPKAISKQAVFDTGEIILTALKRDFGILNPRLAVAGLNPHAGEDGVLGGEDESVIAPAVAADRLVDVVAGEGELHAGPLPARFGFVTPAPARGRDVLPKTAAGRLRCTDRQWFAARSNWRAAVSAKWRASRRRCPAPAASAGGRCSS